MAKYVCSVCGYTHEGSVSPEKCPVCLASASEFSVIQEGVVVEAVKEEAKNESVDSFNTTNSGMDDILKNEISATHEEYETNKDGNRACEVSNLNDQMDSQLDSDEKEIIIQFNRIHTILQVVKWYKETYNVGLKEAKDRVESVLIKHNLYEGGKSGSGCVVTFLVAITSTLSFLGFL